MIKTLFVIFLFIAAAGLAGGFALIIYRQRALKNLLGYSGASAFSRLGDSLGSLRQHILGLNKKYTANKRYDSIHGLLVMLNMEQRISREYFLFMEETAVLAGFLVCGAVIGDPAASLILALGCFFIPEMLLKSRAGRKQEGVLKEMPDAFDIITASIEGGLSLNMAIARYSAKAKNDFASELMNVVKKVQLGKSFEQAMREMDEKLGVKELASFVNAFAQAEKMGGNIKEIIKAQAEEIRKKRFQFLKKKAHEAPVKLLIPLMLFIFPVIFIVLFGPIVIKLIEGL